MRVAFLVMPIIHSLLMIALSRARAGGWQKDEASIMQPLVRIEQMLNPRYCTPMLDQLWSHYFSIADHETGILGHPNYVPMFGRSEVIYQPPLFDCGTASYEDVEAILQRL